jgi:hypothetical protein
MESRKSPAREATSNAKPVLRRKKSKINPSSASRSRSRGGSSAELKALREMKCMGIEGLS